MMSKLLESATNNQAMKVHCMCILWVSSVPTGLIVADFFVPASVPSAKLCLEDTAANTKGKRKKVGPKKGRLAMSALHSRGSPTPSAESKIKKGLRVPLERCAESEVAHKWARWLHNPCRLGGPHQFRARGRIRCGPQVGKVAT